MTAIIHVNADSFEHEVTASSVPVLVDFWAEWCGPCKALNPVLEELAEEFLGRVKVVKVNADAEEGLCAQHNVRGLPTMLFFADQNVENVSNFRSKSQLKKVFEARIQGEGASTALEENLSDPEMRREFLASSEIDRLREFLTESPELVHTPFAENDTPISDAIARKDGARIALLLEFSPVLTLGNLAALGYEDELKSALRDSNKAIDQIEGKYGTPLMQAIGHSKWNTMQILLDSGAQVMNGSMRYATILIGILTSVNVSTLNKLVEAGLDLHVTMEGGFTALHLAVFYSNDVEVVKFLVSKGVPVGARDNSEKKTALEFIAERADGIPDEKIKKAKQDMVAFLQNCQPESVG